MNDLLDQSGTSLQELDGIVCGHGPGSFTGIRIGIGITHGLALGADLGVLGISSLAAMAKATADKHGHDRVVAAFDARMGEVYIGAYADGFLRDSERVCNPESFSWPEGQWLAAGAGFATYPSLAHRAERVIPDAAPCATSALRLAAKMLSTGGSRWGDPADLQPVYLRDQVTHQKSVG